MRSYAFVSPYKPMSYIWDTYRKIDDADQTQNENRMKQQWKPPTPITTLFKQLRDGKKFASQRNEIIHNSHLIPRKYDNIKAIGLFDKDCEKWRNALLHPILQR